MQEPEDNLLDRGWPSSGKKNSPSINFNQIFAVGSLNAATFLSIENVVEQCKSQSSLVTQQLMKNNHLLEELLNICLRPECAQNKQMGITNQHTFKAIQILTCLDYDELSYYFFASNQTDQEQVITQELQQNSVQAYSLPIVKHLFSMLQEKKPIQETRLWYMYRIGLSIFYSTTHKYQVLELFQRNKIISEMLFQHWYSNSILEWFIKLMEIQQSNIFYQTQKAVVFKSLVRSLQVQESNSSLDLEKLANYEMLFAHLIQKIQQASYDQGKYITLCKAIFNLQQQPISFILSRLGRQIQLIQGDKGQFGMEELGHLVAIIEKYLHFSLKYKGAMLNNIHNSISSKQRRRSQSQVATDSNNNGIDNSVILDIILDAQSFSKIKEQVEKLTKIFGKAQPPFPLPRFISLLKLLKSTTFVNQENETSFLERVLTPQFIQHMLLATVKHTSCTILHNLIKDILIEGLYRNFSTVAHILLDQKKSRFLSLINEIKGKINAGDRQYENQLYHIFQVILKKRQEQGSSKILSTLIQNSPWLEGLESRIRKKEQLYTTLIGGDPRKQTSVDSVEDDEADGMLPTQQQQNDRDMIEILSPSANDIIEGNTQHFYDCGGLPLDSDQSKDELENQSEVFARKLSSDQNFPRNVQNHQNLSEKLKILGATQCEEKQVKLLIDNDRKQNKNSSELSHNQQINSVKEIQDKQEQELEDQIRILEVRRHHQNRKNQEQSKLQSQSAALDEGSHKSERRIEHKNSKVEIIDISGILDISSNKEKSKSLDQVQENTTDIHPKQVAIEDKMTVEEECKCLRQKQEMLSPFATYLTYQIHQILSELD